jgi:acyl-CoA thioester hydrolase/thioesterase-3
MYSTFETEIVIRPDDIDMNNHVHNSKYLDYVLAARYDQMIKDYKFSMNDFHKHGYNWVVSIAYIEYKRALKLTDKIIVKTQFDSYTGAQCKVNFWIELKEKKKIASEGHIIYTMISTQSGRPARIPEDLVKHYMI